MPYMHLQLVVEAVYQTGTHFSEIPSKEFSLDVYFHPYPNNILFLWVYLVSPINHE